MKSFRQSSMFTLEASDRSSDPCRSQTESVLTFHWMLHGMTDLPLDHSSNFEADDILVIGHRNPDTDAATSSTAYAAFLNQLGRYAGRAKAVIPGRLTPQAQWVFENAQAEPPCRVQSLAPRVRDVCRSNIVSLQQDQTLGQATDLLIRSGHTMLPMIDTQGRVTGVFSNRDEAGRLLISFDVSPLVSSLLTWDDIVGIQDMQVIGTLPPDSSCGSMHILLEGQASQQIAIQPDDVVVCGDSSVLKALPEGSRPRRVLTVGRGSSASIDDSICELRYAGTVSEFLRQLNRCIRLTNLHFPVGPCVGVDDALRDISSLVGECRRALPVLDNDGRLAGVISRTDLQKTPRRYAILVDHFECSQLAPGLEDLEILEILDHHRVGDVQTMNPVRVDCRPIGSSCSIVALNFFEHDLEPAPSIARLLLGGLCADTLGLTSPTTTPADREVVERLAKIAGVTFETFAVDVLKAGDDLHSANPEMIWNRDQKLFSVRNRRYAVAQLETISLDDLPAEKLQLFRRCVEDHFASSDLLCSLLVITDVLKGDSLVTVCESSETGAAVQKTYAAEAQSANSLPIHKHWLPGPGIVSRKKQMIPQLMRCLSEIPLATS